MSSTFKSKLMPLFESLGELAMDMSGLFDKVYFVEEEMKSFRLEFFHILKNKL